MKTDDRITVLQVAWRFSEGGGKTLIARELLRLPDRSRFDLHAFSVRPLDPADRLDLLGTGIKFHSAEVTDAHKRRGAVRAIPSLTRLIRRLRPDIVHVQTGWEWWTIPGLLLHRDAKLVLEVQDPPGSGKASRHQARLLRLMVKWFGGTVLLHSQWTRDLTSRTLDIPAESFHTLPLGVDSGAIHPPTDNERVLARKALDLPLDRPVVSYVTRLVPTKRPTLFVEVARALARLHPEAICVLAGTGPLRDEITAAAADGSFRYLGFVDDLMTVLHASDVFCSTSGYEGFGLAIAEAMAAGVPPVVVSVGGTPDVVGEIGGLIDSSDPREIADEVYLLLSDPVLRKKRSEAARARVEANLDIHETVRRIEDLWTELARSAR